MNIRTMTTATFTTTKPESKQCFDESAFYYIAKQKHCQYSLSLSKKYSIFCSVWDPLNRTIYC